MSARDILIVYGTTYGQTEKIARRMAEWLRESGDHVVLANADEIPYDLHVADFDGVLIGGSVLFGRHKASLRKFVRAERRALGPVKFVFPNPYNVYLHGTPARELFRETRRDFSHGCIRVADPSALATFVLRGQGEWNAAAITRAMEDAWSRRVSIARPIEVLTLYGTVVRGDDGLVRFYPDIYGHDAALARALRLPLVADLTADAP